MTTPTPSQRVRVWSLTVRLLHMTLAVSTIAAFVTHEGGSRWHEAWGYIALACAAIRIAHGFIAKDAARFSSFVLAAQATLDYAKQVWQKSEPSTLGHNPLGAWMIVALLSNAVFCSITGALFTTNWLYGYAWLANLHSISGHLFIPMVLLHLAGVAYGSWRHKVSLVGAMVHGDKVVVNTEVGM